ncbi:MAG: iron uptake porin, partial [Waterburya sp.]
MKIKFKQKIKLGIIVITSFFNTSAALANNIESIPAVSKLKNIHTGDWEYQALQSLAQRYSCTEQWQNNQSNLPLSRYEFAVGLNHCLQQIDTITSQQDLTILQRLQQDFAQELAQLTNKVSQLEANITQLESDQFSTTTKFNGQTLFFLTDSFGQEDNSQTTFGYRTRLIFDTSFSGQDLLRVRLESSDLGRLDDVTDTSLSRLSVDSDSDNQIEISELSYTFQTSDRTEILFGTAGVSLNDVGEVLNPFSSSSSGAVSRFGRRDPATLRAPGGAGIGIKQEFSDEILGFAGYFVN